MSVYCTYIPSTAMPRTTNYHARRIVFQDCIPAMSTIHCSSIVTCDSHDFPNHFHRTELSSLNKDYYYYLYFNTGFLRPMVKDSRNPGACGVLLLPWVVPLWSLDGPERFLLFHICAFTVYFWKRVWLPMAMTSVCSPFINCRLSLYCPFMDCPCHSTAPLLTAPCIPTAPLLTGPYLSTAPLLTAPCLSTAPLLTAPLSLYCPFIDCPLSLYCLFIDCPHISLLPFINCPLSLYCPFIDCPLSLYCPFIDCPLSLYCPFIDCPLYPNCSFIECPLSLYCPFIDCPLSLYCPFINCPLYPNCPFINCLSYLSTAPLLTAPLTILLNCFEWNLIISLSLSLIMYVMSRVRLSQGHMPLAFAVGP